MDKIEEKLKEKRPNLSESSIKTYSILLNSLYKKMYKDEPINIIKFSKVKDTIEALKNTPYNVRKTILSALYVLTDRKTYKNHMVKDIKKYDKEINKQEKTEKEKKYWIEQEEIFKKLEELKKKAELSYELNDNYQAIQNYILLCLLCGKYIPPRRAKDFTEFKIKNINTTKDNFIIKNHLYFNNYKGSEKKGLQIIKIPTELKNILNRWIKINKNDYLFFDKNDNKLDSIKINQRLNKIFNNKISINALRHFYLTAKHKYNIESLEVLKDDFKLMGSSILQSKIYIKI